MRILQTVRWIVDHPLSRGRRLRNVARYLHWQLSSRLFTRERDFAYVNDTKLLVRRGMTGATGNYYVGLHEFADMAFLMHFLRPTDLFADVGANIGSYTILAGAAVGSRVEAFEPILEAFGWLQRNVALNDIEERCSLRCVAVGASCGEARFTSKLDTTNHISDEGDVTVPMVALSGSLSECPAAIKVDVEGHEQAVMAGASRWLSHPDLKCLIVETGAGSAAARTLEAEGFKRYAYDPFQRELKESYDSQLFIRDPDKVRARLKTAPKFKVRGWTI